MDSKKITRLVIGIVALSLIIAAIVFVVQLVGRLIGGAFNIILGIIVIIALILIVAWMFWYAGRHNK